MTSPARTIDVADVRSRHPIEDVIAAAGIELRRSGRGYLACCPFHDDSTASLSVAGVPDRYHCFGCGATGDVIDFIERLHGLGFRDAVAFLDQSPARMPLTPAPLARSLPGSARPHSPAAGAAPERGYQVNALAWQWYSRPVAHDFAVAYLRHHRGIDLTDAERQLGHALVGHTGHGWTHLHDHLQHLGVTGDELLALDLAQRTRDGRLIDSLRDRLIVPIPVSGGRVAGFVGRDTSEHPAAPKYRNPTRTVVYDKATSLYQPVQDTGSGATLVVVEGALDALAVTAAAAQAGRLYDPLACAALGTAVTPAQARQVLDLTTGPVVIALDGDQPGRDGTLRWVNASLGAGRLVHVTSLPDGLDPADWLTRHGAEGLAALDPAQRHTTITDTVTVRARPPGRELAQLAARERHPVHALATHLARLIPALPAVEARELVEAATAELTRQGCNPDGALPRALADALPPPRRPTVPAAPAPVCGPDLI